MRPIKKIEHQNQRGVSLPRARATRAGSVRIIGGQWRRTPLIVPDIDGLRPSGDRVRETLIIWIRHLFVDLEDRTVLDLFAGSGALGFEAASQGARRVVMFEKSNQAVAALKASQKKLKADMIEIRSGDSLLLTERLQESFDLIFLDPPFALDMHEKVLSRALRVLKPNGMIYMESPKEMDITFLEALGLEIIRESMTGNVAYRLLTLKEDWSWALPFIRVRSIRLP